jgi:hypothetical protein
MFLPKIIYESLPYSYITFSVLIWVLYIQHFLVWVVSIILVMVSYIILHIRTEFRKDKTEEELRYYEMLARKRKFSFSFKNK